MKLKDIFWLSYKDLKEKRVRTALTIVMVVIGVASIIALSSQTAGISATIQSSLQSLGPTSIILTSVSGIGFTVADSARISTLPNVSTATPILTGQVTMFANNQNASATLIGVTPENLQNLLGSVNLYQGSIYKDTIAPSAVVGYSIAFPSSLAGRQNIIVGQPVTMKFAGRNGETLTVPVIGILQQYGASIISIDSGVVVSLSAAQVLLHRSSFNMILIKATNTSSVDPLSTLITTIYGNSARVLNTQQLAQTASTIISSISTLLIIIAGISLLVAAIGITNIMLIAVLERTHEIGILKSVGFRNRHILYVFLFQALIIGIVGGVIGIVAGMGASYSLTFLISNAQASNASALGASGTQFRSSGFGGLGGGGGGGVAVSTGFGSSSLTYQPVFAPSTIATAILVAVLVSIIAGIYPAWRASRMEPIEALRQL